MGMEFDLRTFPSENSGEIVALKTIGELDHYTYLVAGCVGEFWTEIACAHLPQLSHWNVADVSRYGVRFGKALQMTNILRDCADDLRIGRCYLPLEKLLPANLRPEDLRQPENSLQARPVLFDLTHRALEHFHEAACYILLIPRRCIRLRLACLWPVLIGLRTLMIHAGNEAWLDPHHRSKITRRDIYRIVLLSLPIVGSNAIVKTWIERWIADVIARLQPGIFELKSQKKEGRDDVKEMS
jgi:farnesyl-diphosphate farnesyltransferase